MVLNKQRGNMYGFVTDTWNPIRGRCEHNCKYCFMIPMNPGKLRLDSKTLKDNLGDDRYIFVGSSTDMFAEEVPTEWIKEVLIKCNEYTNKYLFQTKNPKRFYEFMSLFPKDSILTTTIESDINHMISLAPSIKERVEAMSNISQFDKMLTIEPILDFNPSELIKIIKEINPKFVNIGADSKEHYMKEPSKDKLMKLINHLNILDNIKVTLKDNLRRLL